MRKGKGESDSESSSDDDSDDEDGAGDGAEQGDDATHNTQDLINQIIKLKQNRDPSQRKTPHEPKWNKLRIHEVAATPHPRERFTPRDSARGQGSGAQTARF